MFPSPNCDNPFESLLKRSSSSSSSFPSHENPTFNFPSPFLDEHESPLNQIFLQNPHINNVHDPLINLGKAKVEEQTAEVIPPLRRRSLGVIPRRRVGKKDRHSKICTAQGIRDRRMRLSLQVARKFFDLQDMLGYDKASKTIEWLFTQSKKAIKELVDDHHSPAKSESFLSECEELSGIEEINSNVVVAPLDHANQSSNAANPSSVNPTEATKPPSSCKRESREKARARARCRTREKMLVKCFQISGENSYKPNPSNNSNNIGKLGSFEGSEDQEANPNIQEIRFSPFEAAYSTIEQQLSDVGTIERFLGNSSSDFHCAAAVSDYADPNSGSFMGFLGNWDVLSNDKTTNCLQYSSVTNQVSFAGNLNSLFSATAEFP